MYSRNVVNSKGIRSCSNITDGIRTEQTKYNTTASLHVAKSRGIPNRLSFDIQVK